MANSYPPYDPNDPKTWTVRNPNADPNDPKSRMMPNPNRTRTANPRTGKRGGSVRGSGPAGVVQDPRGRTIANSEPPGDRPLDIRGLQAHLKAQGYDIRVDNKVGPKTLSALADYLQLGKGTTLSPAMAKLLKGTVITGRRDPQAWNSRFGSPATRPVVQTTTADPHGNADVSGAVPGAGDVAGATTTPVIDLSQLFAGVTTPATKGLPESWANSGAQLFGGDVAEKLAGLQYDTPIRDLGIEKSRMGRTNEQNLADVKNWFGQVLGSQKTAATRDAAITKAGVGSVRDAGAAILSAIGGEASEGAGMAGAANASAVGTLEALGANQAQYNEDLRPLLEAEKAGASAREKALGTSRAQDLANRLIAMQGEKGRAQAGFQFEIDQANNGIRDTRAQRALEIRQANNGIAQQNFQNALALAQAQMGAAVTGIEIEKGVAELQGVGSKPTSYPFAKAPQSQRQQAFDMSVARLQRPDGRPVPYPQAVQAVRNTLNGFGWSFRNPGVRTLAINIMQAAGYSPDPRNFGPK